MKKIKLFFYNFITFKNMSSFELFEQRDYERNCSKRSSPRKARNNKLLPPECHQTILSSCNERVSPRRQRGIDCLDVLGPQQPAPSQIQRQSSSSEIRRGNIVINSNRSNNGSSVRNGSNRRSTTPQNAPIETVIETKSVSVLPNDQDIKMQLQQDVQQSSGSSNSSKSSSKSPSKSSNLYYDGIANGYTSSSKQDQYQNQNSSSVAKTTSVLDGESKTGGNVVPDNSDGAQNVGNSTRDGGNSTRNDDGYVPSGEYYFPGGYYVPGVGYYFPYGSGYVPPEGSRYLVGGYYFFPYSGRHVPGRYYYFPDSGYYIQG